MSIAVEDRLFGAAGADGSLARMSLPPRLRAHAALGVLDVTEFFGETSGGIRTYLMEKARYVESRPALRQILVVPGPADAVTEGDGVRCYRLRGPRVPRQHPYRFMLATRSNGRIIAHERPDIVEVGSPLMVPWIAHRATRRLHIPLVHFFHSHYPRAMVPTRRGGPLRVLAGSLAWSYARLLDRRFATTIVASEFAAADLRRAGIDRVDQVPLGVDLLRFDPARRTRMEQTRALLGVPLHAPVAAFVGRFAPEKELDVLLDAWPRVERACGAHLVLVGDGPLGARLKARTRSRRIHFRAFERDRDRLADLLAAVDVFIAPGAVETFGLAALEALASGTPVLSADEGGVAEQVRVSGGGALFRAHDSRSLARGVIEVLASNADDLSRRARAFAEREHAWPVVFDRLFSIYAAIVGQAG